MELERMVGFWNRCFWRYGLSCHGFRFIGHWSLAILIKYGEVQPALIPIQLLRQKLLSFSFPARENMPKNSITTCKSTLVRWGPASKPFWSSSGRVKILMADGLGGCLFIGSKDSLMCGSGGYNARLMSGRVPNVKPYLRRIPGGSVFYPDGPHEQDWIRACKESPESRVSGHFKFCLCRTF